MTYRAVIRGEAFTFPSLRELLAAANEEKSGDQLAGIAARDERERVAAKSRWRTCGCPRSSHPR